VKSTATGRRYVFAAMSVLLACVAVAAPARAQGPSMRDMFKGIPTDRCKEMGGPPPSDADGPRIDSINVKEGKPGTVVLLKGVHLDPAWKYEVRFLLKGRDLRAESEPDGPSGVRARVPDFGVSDQPAKGWVYLSRGDLRGRSVPFLFLTVK
jgi:hypothetical protein